MDNSKPQTIIRLVEVKRRTGLSTSTIYHWMKCGLFPTQVNLGNKLVGWKEAEIDKWVSSRSDVMDIR
ncbi:MAG: hypothetical protein DI586_05300 [Micavibrio aeruginosavorus]|uniref:AlpA family transcriptional regulator n=1 Tax=Micavibrio aeruginosavorus TaxID=349221 RepID=A0A2W5HCT4_9BACT|nr:MAG: hypothetical protein DI586_05300 [Micavibrio aeruginosavorus]